MELHIGALQTLGSNKCWEPPRQETALQKRPMGADGHQDEHEP